MKRRLSFWAKTPLELIRVCWRRLFKTLLSRKQKRKGKTVVETGRVSETRKHASSTFWGAPVHDACYWCMRALTSSSSVRSAFEVLMDDSLKTRPFCFYDISKYALHIVHHVFASPCIPQRIFFSLSLIAHSHSGQKWSGLTRVNWSPNLSPFSPFLLLLFNRFCFLNIQHLL